jgi:hypothetical protein
MQTQQATDSLFGQVVSSSVLVQYFGFRSTGSSTGRPIDAVQPLFSLVNSGFVRVLAGVSLGPQSSVFTEFAAFFAALFRFVPVGTASLF